MKTLLCATLFLFTASTIFGQDLIVEGSATIDENVGIGITNPSAALHILKEGSAPLGLPAGENGLLLGLDSINGNKWIQSYGGDLAINSQGNLVGIGTNTPNNLLDLGITNGKKLAVFQNTDGNDFYGFGISTNLLEFYAGVTVAASPQIVLEKGTGNVGIGTIMPSAQLHTTGSVRFENFGAGTLQTDAIGNLSVSSDERLKKNTSPYKRGLKEIMEITPITYNWKEESGLDTEGLYAGFSAQNVREYIPEAVSMDSKGYYTLSDRPIIASLVGAVKEQQKTISKQQSEIETLKHKLTLIESMKEELAQIKALLVNQRLKNASE